MTGADQAGRVTAATFVQALVRAPAAVVAFGDTVRSLTIEGDAMASTWFRFEYPVTSSACAKPAAGGGR